jgi:hypothetical protein
VTCDCINLRIVLRRIEENLAEERRDNERLRMRLAETRDQRETMERALLELDSRGGLGHEKHNLIRDALGLPKVGA